MSHLYRLLLHQEVTDFTVKLHFDYDCLQAIWLVRVDFQ